jgi:hypothetical protein
MASSPVVPQAVYIWLLIGLTLDPLLPVVAPLLGVPLQPGMERPYLATSVREFWGQRCARGQREVVWAWAPLQPGTE